MKKIIKNAVATLLLAAAFTTASYAEGPAASAAPAPAFNTYSSGSFGGFSDRTNSYFGFRFGYNAATLRFKDVEDMDCSAMSGFNVGFVAGWQLGNIPVYFEPGLFYSAKGSKSEFGLMEAKTKLHMLEVPFVLKYIYDVPVIDGLSVQPFFGGFLSMGLAGKEKISAIKREYKLYQKDALRRCDAGLRFGVGGQIDFFYLDFSYDLGLSDLAKKEEKINDAFFGTGEFGGYDDFDNKLRSGCFSITFGVNF